MRVMRMMMRAMRLMRMQPRPSSSPSLVPTFSPSASSNFALGLSELFLQAHSNPQ